MRSEIQEEKEEEIAMKSPYLASSRVSPNFSQQDLPSWAPAEGRKADLLCEKGLDVFAADDAKLSDSPACCWFQPPSKTVHQEDSSGLRRMDQAPLPTVSPAQTVYCHDSAPYSTSTVFPSPRGPLPPLVSSCPPFGSIASFSPASLSYSPIYHSSSLTAKHSSSFGPGHPSTFGPSTFLSSSPSFDSPELQAIALPELPRLALPSPPLPVRSVILAPKATSKPFPCHHCSKGFERLEHLTRHRATDSHLRTLRAKGIQCFDPPVTLTRCPFCEHKFNRSDNLKPHLITHMHNRPEGRLRGSKSVSVEEVARLGLAWIDPRVNPRVKGPKKVKNVVGKARVRKN